jgi:Flp pilus assembly protein TadD
MAAGKKEEGIATFKQALIVKPKDYDMLFSLGMAYNQTGRYDDSIAALKEALEVKSNSEHAVMMLAQNYVAKGDRAAARELLPRLRELDENLANILERSLGPAK